MKKYVLFIVCLLFLVGCSTTQVSTKGQDFWTHHGWIQLLGWIFFPRMMFWFFSAMTGGFGFWLGVLFIPRLMVAFWATTYYWNTNPILCIFCWIYAIGGEHTEKKTIKRS